MAAKKEKDISELFSEMSLLNYEIGSHFYAKPTYLVDPHNFFIIPFPFLSHLRKLSKPGEPIQVAELKENMVVIYRSENPNVNKYLRIDIDENIRGVIQSINEDKTCQVYALDRGFIENNVTVDRLFHPANQESLTVPSLVQHCELFFCVPIGEKFSKDAVEAFEFFVGNEKLSIVVKGVNNGKLSIVMYNSSPDDVATMLALTHYTCLTVNTKNDLDSVPFLPAPPKLAYKHKALNLNDVLKVRVQSGSTLKEFYVTPMEDYKVYLQNRPDFTNYCKSLKDISDKDFKTGALVGVYETLNLSYERGVILEVLDDKAKVKLVDWGVEKIVYKDYLKTIDCNVYLESPVKAIYCSAVEGFVPWDNGLNNFLYKGYTFVMKVEKVGYKFEKPHVVNIAKAGR